MDRDTDSGSGTNYASFCRQSRTGDLDVELVSMRGRVEPGEGRRGQGTASVPDVGEGGSVGRGGGTCKRKLRRPERTSRA